MEKNAIMKTLLGEIVPKCKWAIKNDIMGESQLYEGLSIEAWKKIADAVQQFEINDASLGELDFNLGILRKALKKMGVSYLETGNTNPENSWEIGLASLIEHIYSISAIDKKEHFVNQINELEKIGVDTIALSTNEDTI